MENVFNSYLTQKELLNFSKFYVFWNPLCSLSTLITPHYSPGKDRSFLCVQMVRTPDQTEGPYLQLVADPWVGHWKPSLACTAERWFWWEELTPEASVSLPVKREDENKQKNTAFSGYIKDWVKRATARAAYARLSMNADSRNWCVSRRIDLWCSEV